LAGIGKAGLSLVPMSPSRRTFGFTLGSDNQSSGIGLNILIFIGFAAGPSPYVLKCLHGDCGSLRTLPDVQTKRKGQPRAAPHGLTLRMVTSRGGCAVRLSGASEPATVPVREERWNDGSGRAGRRPLA
jgi:hypothetical protein